MKHLFGVVLALVLVAFGVSPVAAQSTKFAYINSQKILAQAPGATDAQKTFESEMQRYRLQVDSLGKNLERQQQDLQRQESTLSAAARQQKQQALQQQFASYQQRVAELERTAQQRQAQLVEPIMKRVTEVIEVMRKEGGYAMIFDASAGSLITADPSLDLTDRVLARLRTTASR